MTATSDKKCQWQGGCGKRRWMPVPLASFGPPSHASKIQGGRGDWFPRKDKKCCSAGMRTLKPDEPKKRRPQRIVRALASWTRPRPGYPLSGCVPASRRAGTFHRASIRVVLRHRDRNTRTSIPGTHGTPEPCLRKSIQWDAFPTQIPEEPYHYGAASAVADAVRHPGDALGLLPGVCAGVFISPSLETLMSAPVPHFLPTSGKTARSMSASSRTAGTFW